jgi:hypothetical protein
MLRKLLDVSKLASFGWKSSIGLYEGITSVYREKFLNQPSFNT